MSLGCASPARAFRRAKLLAHAEHSASGEDRWAADPERRRWALCDGASEGWDSGAWAGALSSTLVRGGPCLESIARARRDFAISGAGPQDWLTQRASARGSWSTALLVEIGRGGRSLHASAIGDSCLFVLDGFDIMASFPLETALAFSNTPDLVADRVLPGDGEPTSFRNAVFKLGDLRRPSILLATDALAAFLLQTADKQGVLRFLASATIADFETWTRRKTAEGSLRRDDLTLLWIR